MIKEKLFSENAGEIEQNEKVVEEDDLKKKEDKPDNANFEDKKVDISKNKIVNEEIETEIVREKNKEDPNVIAFKEMGKARDTDSKIISFFTKIFDDEEEEKIITLKKPDPEYKTKPVKIETLEEGNNLPDNIEDLNEEEITLDDQSDNMLVENKMLDINKNLKREKEDLAFFRPQPPEKKKY